MHYMDINKRIYDFKNRKPASKEAIDRNAKRAKRLGLSENEPYRQYLSECSCNICGEKRALELCHIVPVSKGGHNHPMNLIVLCPTHHSLFDKALLNDNEMDKILTKLDIAYKYHELNSVKVI